MTNTDHHSNSFDFLRCAAAFTVLVSHSFPLNGLPDTGYGWLAVTVFFIISGYLITASWQRTPNVKAFAIKRAARILPGLIVIVALTALVLAPLLEVAPLVETES
jgi:peptidoglycan/LPS O-acetylase OafA/YrhL